MAKDVRVSYDKEGDVLYIGFGKKESAEAVEISDDVYARISPKGKRLVGITIVGVKNRLKTAKELEIKLPK